MSAIIIEQLKAAYASFDKNLLPKLSDLYAENVEFIDPIHTANGHTVNGLKKLTSYYEEAMQDLLLCHFIFHQTIVDESRNEAVLVWTMRYQHAKLASGQLIEMQGNSHLRYNEKIIYHRDYYDLGVMVYEHIPVLGLIIKKIKQRLALK